MNEWCVEIIDMKTGEVVKRMGPMPERKAERVEMGALRNMDLERYSTRMISEDGEER